MTLENEFEKKTATFFLEFNRQMDNWKQTFMHKKLITYEVIMAMEISLLHFKKKAYR